MESEYRELQVPDPAAPLEWDAIDMPLSRRFEACARAFAGRPAVEDASGTWTYDRLNRFSNRIARKLAAERGAGPEPVAVLFEQGAFFLAALLGVLKAGKFYVPLDPLFPAARNAHILNDSGAGLLITDRAHAALAGEYCRGALPVLDIQDNGLPDDESDPELAAAPDAPALLIYTSGSTGMPKGVLHDQRTLIHNSVRQHDLMAFTPADRFSMLYSSSVMGTVRDYTNALLNGASLHPFDIRGEGLARLVDFLTERRLTIFHTIPGVFRHLGSVLERGRQLPDLRFVILGGETLLRSDFEIFRRHFPAGCRLFTGLGLTETGTVRQNILTPQSEVTEATVPLGYPLRDVEVCLLDAAGSPVKAGEVGEIAVRSRYIAGGYWRNPGKTSPAPFREADREEVRVFRTGDLGLLLPDGCLVHKGRSDFQIKLRGFRIELQEIETVILESGLAQDAVVTGYEVRPGERCLVAYLVPPAGRTGLAEEIRSYLKLNLPDHMVPTLFVELERLPHTPNGKVDRQALPPPEFGRPAAGEDAPRDEVESALVDLWKEILSVDRVGVQESFFDLGGNSILASAMFIQVERRFGRSFPLSLLIEKNTIRQLADALREPSPGIGSSLVAVRTGGSNPPLFVLPGGHGDVLYMRALARHLPPGQPLYGIQAAPVEGDLPDAPRIERIAARYLLDISSVQAHGPYLLAGHSFGGYVALEMARLLLGRGERVALLAIFDTYPPGRRVQTSLRNRLLIHAENLRALSGKQKLDYIRERSDDFTLRLVRNPRLAGLLHKPGSPQDRNMAISRAARYNYDPPPYPGDVALFKASERPWYVTWDPMARWPEYVGGELRTFSIPGGHDTILFEPHVRLLAQELERCIERALAPEE